MCRNIKPLFNYDPPATQQEIRDAAVQYVRKLSGMNKPSDLNEIAFDQAVDSITLATKQLVDSLKTTAKPHNREVEAEKARKRNEKRFGTSKSVAK